MTEPEKRTFTIAEVKTHNKSDDVWFIVHDKVYDATKFLAEHPGGEDVLKDAAGTNATTNFEDANHSDIAREQMQSFYLGDIVDDEKVEGQNATKNKSKKPCCMIGISALAVALGAIILYKGYKLSVTK